jgi:hypothetical protein
MLFDAKTEFIYNVDKNAICKPNRGNFDCSKSALDLKDSMLLNIFILSKSMHFFN